MSFARQTRVERSPRGYVSVRGFPGDVLLAMVVMLQAKRDALANTPDEWNAEMQRLESVAVRKAKKEFKKRGMA